MFTEAFDNYRSKIAKDAILLFEGEVQPDDYTGEPKLRVEKVFTMDEARARFSRGVLLDLCMDAVTPDLPARLKSCLEPHRHDGAGCPVPARGVARACLASCYAVVLCVHVLRGAAGSPASNPYVNRTLDRLRCG